MATKWMSRVLALTAVTLVLGSCAGNPLPVLTSPVRGSSSVGLWLAGAADESATVGPCTATDRTIEVTTDSPNSSVTVRIERRVAGSYDFIGQAVIPAGIGSTSVDVPAGCFRISLQATERYCDGSFFSSFPCPVVLPPTYRFRFTITF